MEDYDTFVQLCVSQLRKNEEEEQKYSKPLSAPSVIRFCGRPILPPLLSEKQREEMRRHRDEMQKATVQKKSTDDPRMARVQTILHSVQLRKTPTLEELLEESEIKNEFLHPQNTSKASHSAVFVGTMETLTPASGVFSPPKTSTTYSAFCPDVSPQQSYPEECLNDQRDSQQESQPCSFSGIHPSPSSGYVTYENPENTVSISEWTESEPERHEFISSEEIDKVGFFLQNTSNTIAKMPDIINHPPIDGEDLERSGLESVFLQVKDIDDASFHNDSLTCDPPNNEQFGISHLENVEHEEHIPFSTKPDFSDYVGKNEGLVTFPDNIGLSDNLNVSQKSFKPPCLTSEPQKKPSEAEPEPVDNQIKKLGTKQSEELHPMSLQALLKKSQEYRRRQRLLRSQAKNTKIQEKTQEQPKARTQEQSLSDKENEDKDTGTAEDKKTKEQRGNFIPSVEKNTIESEAAEERSNVKNKSVTQNENTTEPMSAEEETTLKNKLNSFQEFITQSKQSSSLIQQRPTSAGRYQDTFNRNSCLKGSHKGVRTYCSVPVPNFCLSPVHFKNKDSPKGGLTIEEETSIENSDLNQVKAVSSTANLMTGDDFTGVFAKSSLHIDQLESSLSCLKVLISDLESTVKENLDNQTESNMQSESGFKSMKQSELIENDQLEQRDRSGGVAGEPSDDDGRELPRRQSIDFKTFHEDLESETSFIDVDGACLSVQERALECVKLNQEKMCKTAATERDKGKEECAKGFVRSDASTRQQFPTKSLTSVAQLMLVPDMFRSGLSENTLSCDTSVLSDQSNRPELKEREVTAEGQRSVRSPSLNQSYDVAMPSGLWLLEGSGSDLGSQSHLGRESYLTPDSGGEEQGGVSKVKRRLLMHLTDETREQRSNMSGAASSVGRPNSSTPGAAVHLYEDTKTDRQEQLKQAHAAQVRALQDKHRKQQEELLQVLAARYRLLQSVSPRSRPGDTLTFSTLSQPLHPLLQRYRPLLAAAVKGFLTRRLLKTERVAQLLRTIRDTQQLLQALQPQDATRGEFCSRQDDVLQERVALQLRAARYEVHDIFFSLSAGEQMQLIGWDRELIKDRQLRQQNGHSGSPRRKSFLSAATQKSLERKREMMIQKGAAELHRGVLTKTGQKSGFTAKKPQETKRGQFKANPQRVPKSCCSSRPR